MSSQPLIPPLRDLPAGRLAERSRHLRAEVVARRGGPSPRLVIAIGLAIVLGILLATPALGLRDQVFHFFTGERHPPEIVVRRFENLFVGPPGRLKRSVKAGEARNVMSPSLPGYGKWPIWVAPVRGGGFCTSIGLCDLHSTPLDATLTIAGPSPKRPPDPLSANETVVFEGFTSVPGAHVSMRFEDGSAEQIPLVRVTAPIRASFFVYELRKAHWKLGARPVALVAANRAGKVVARDTKAAGYFRDAQRHRLATPAEAETSSRRVWVFVAGAAALLGIVAVLLWRRRGLAVAVPLVVAATITAAFAGVGLARSGGYHAPAPPKPKPYTPLPTYHSFASGYVQEGFLGSHRLRDRFLVARTPAEGQRWDRWITHHRVSPPQSANFSRQALVGVFLLGRPSDRVESVAVTKMRFSGSTLRLSLVVSPEPIATCGPGPDSASECQPFYKPHNSSYHAFTIVAIPRAEGARLRRIVVVRERRARDRIQIGVPHTS